MCVLGGRGHWLGPVVGAGVVHVINDRLSGPGMGNLSEILMGLLLMVVVAALPEGIYSQLRLRGAAAGLVGLAAMGAALVARLALLDALAVGIAVAVLFLVVQGRRFPLGWGQRGKAGEVEAAGG